MNIQAKQLNYILIGLIVLLAAGFFAVAYETNTVLGGQANKLSQLKAKSNDLETIIKYKDLNTIAETIVPQDKDQAEAVREIVKLAADSGISKLSSITFPSSTLGSLTPGAGRNPNLTQLTPIKGTPGVYQLPITISQDSNSRVPYGQFTTFLSKLEQNRRTAQVSGITIQPDTQHPNNVAFTLIINEFIKP
jgi:hypothetical protein